MSLLHVRVLYHEITHVPTNRKINRISLTCKIMKNNQQKKVHKGKVVGQILDKKIEKN